MVCECGFDIMAPVEHTKWMTSTWDSIAEFKISAANFRVLVYIFSPFSDYLIGHPSGLQTTTNVD